MIHTRGPCSVEESSVGQSTGTGAPRIKSNPKSEAKKINFFSQRFKTELGTVKRDKMERLPVSVLQMSRERVLFVLFLLDSVTSTFHVAVTVLAAASHLGTQALRKRMHRRLSLRFE